nr:zinc finger, CCHC-type [Tanacetum cinerariifolium]
MTKSPAAAERGIKEQQDYNIAHDQSECGSEEPLRDGGCGSIILNTNDSSCYEQYNELLGILGMFTQHKMNMDDAIQVSCIIDKLPSSWKDFKHTLKHLKEELTLVELGSHLRIEESFRVQDSDKPKGNNVADPSIINMVEHNVGCRWPRSG